MRVGHLESRAGLAIVRGWNQVEAEEDLFYPTQPHNLGMPSWSGYQEHYTLHYIFLYFPVVPSGTMFRYSTRKRKMNKKERQKNVVSTGATADIHTYFLRRYPMKFTFLLKRHQQAAETMGGIFRCRGLHSCSSCHPPPHPT